MPPLLRQAIPTLLALGSLAAEPLPTATLLAPRQSIAVGKIDSSNTLEWDREGEILVLRGPGRPAGTLTLRPAPADSWDFDAFNHLRIDLENPGKSLVRIEASLENADAVAWANSLPGSAIVPAGASGTLGFSFTRPATRYDGPELFRSQSARPNGHRSHWRPFDPAAVRSLRLTFHASGPFEIRLAPPSLCWPAGSAANQDLEALPYLDRFGQTRALDWPGKILSESSLRQEILAQAAQTTRSPGIPGWNRFGGWQNGPQLPATGRFRIEKSAGRWWFVDPEGRLFWSHGANSIGAGISTPVTAARKDFFEWLPDAASPRYGEALRRPREDAPPAIDFLTANAHRVWGGSAAAKRRDLDHHRLRVWGLNTLGAWSDTALMQDRRTPYTLTTSVWWPVLHRSGGHTLPDPFDPAFETSLRKSLENLAWARNDPWCLGIFVDNELEWANDLAPLLLAAPKQQAARLAFLESLRKRHPDLAGLNQAWGSSFGSWEEIKLLAQAPPRPAFAADVAAFYTTFADRYFATCQRLIRELLPGTLYLGCRIHRAPENVIRSAARHVDVFSANRYESLAAASMLPAEIDRPLLITEFHFGAPDRGVPGTGLRSVHDQTQRGLAYSAYVAAGLLDPRVVGTHWFAWPDQSAAGRPGENYQIGFLDVTGRAYPEFTRSVRQLSEKLYPLRHQPPASVEQALETILAPLAPKPSQP